MRNLFLFMAAFSILMPVFGCTGGSPATGGTETGNTTAVTIRVVGYQSSQLAALEMPALTVGDLEINTAYVVLDRLRFRPLSVCADGAEDDGAEDIQLDGPFIVDLLNPEILSGLEDVEIPTGRYCRVEMALKKLEEGSGVMLNRSVLIEGLTADATPFTMITEVDEEFELQSSAAGFLIEAGDTTTVFFIAFDLDRWFDGVDLSSPDVAVTGGTILIDDDNNESVQEVIEENLKHSTDLIKDSDEDEHLDPEEEEDSLAEG